jgi:hypothetical protein
MGPQVPSVPAPFFAAEQASHLPLQGESQQKPSMHCPPWQSERFRHFFPFAQSGQGPPQSTSVSPSSLIPSVHVDWQVPFAQ